MQEERITGRARRYVNKKETKGCDGSNDDVVRWTINKEKSLPHHVHHYVIQYQVQYLRNEKRYLIYLSLRVKRRSNLAFFRPDIRELTHQYILYVRAIWLRAFGLVTGIFFINVGPRMAPAVADALARPMAASMFG
jgi:hypothetical protein